MNGTSAFDPEPMFPTTVGLPPRVHEFLECLAPLCLRGSAIKLMESPGGLYLIFLH